MIMSLEEAVRKVTGLSSGRKAYFVPTSSALQLSRKAPAKISLALAVCSFTRMVRGRVVSGSPTAVTALSSLIAPVCVTTMGALSAHACLVSHEM